MREEDVIPLMQWIHGRLRIHFRNSHIAELQMSLDAAESLRRQIDDKQGAESIHGLHAHDGWVSAKGDEIVLTEWEPAIDYGWPNSTTEERAALKALGMSRGVLHALATLWADRGRHDAGYSPSAVAALYRLATRETLTRDEWDEVAELVEGDDGTRLLNELLIDLPDPKGRRTPSHERSDGGLEAESAEAAAGSGADRAMNDESHPARGDCHGPAASDEELTDAALARTEQPSQSSNVEDELSADGEGSDA